MEKQPGTLRIKSGNGKNNLINKHMLIIDINKQKVQNNPHFDLDVVVIKGASGDLISSLAALSTSATVPTNTCCGRTKKVALAHRTERISHCVPESIKAESNGQYNL